MIRSDWNEEKLELCRADGFTVRIRPNHDKEIGSVIMEHITVEDWERLKPKLEMVEKLAARLAAAMLKGTLKYESDSHSVLDWLGHGLDDSGDAFLYFALAREAYLKEREGEK